MKPTCFLLAWGFSLGLAGWAEDWPQYLHDAARTGYTAEAVVPPLVEAWRFDRAVARSYTPPVVAEGKVIFGSSHHHLYALDAATGQPLWWFQTGGDLTAAPAVADGRVFCASEDHALYAVDLQTGQGLWKQPTRANLRSAPAVDRGKVFVGSEDEHLYAMEAATGKVLWRFRLGGDVGGAPCVTGNLVVVVADNREAAALDTETGQLVWRQPVHTEVWTPAAAEGYVYLDLPDRGLERLQADTGRPLGLSLRFHPRLQPILTPQQSLSFVPEGLRLVRHNGQVQAFSPFIAGGSGASPLAAGGIVYWAQLDQVLAFDLREKKTVWSFQVGSPVTGLAAAEGRLYVATQQPAIWAFQPLSGLPEGERRRYNLPPAAAIQGPAQGFKRQPLRFIPVVSDPDHDETEWQWIVPDGQIVGRWGSQIEVAFPRSGDFEVQLRVRDARGATALARHWVRIVNRPPVAVAQGDRQVPDLHRAELDATRSSDPDGDQLFAEWIELIGYGPVVKHYFSLGDHRVWLWVQCHEPPDPTHACTNEDYVHFSIIAAGEFLQPPGVPPPGLLR
jgi:outer membrane protein assembly factor BamB